MAGRNIIVVGCSVGGVKALQKLAAGLPENFSASIFVVMHLAPETTSVLPDILARAGSLPASHPRDGEAFRPSHIYVAPPDHHLLIENGRMRVKRGPRENRYRPGVDPLFRSAARAHGRHVIGVVLTGGLDDGTAGLLSIKKRGGVAVVQDPNDAQLADMPRSAIESVAVDYVVPLDRMPGLLAEVAAQQVSDNGASRSSRQASRSNSSL